MLQLLSPPPQPALTLPVCVDAILELPQDLPLSCGQTLVKPKIAYRRIGNPDLPVILVLGGISASRQAWQPDSAQQSGWWQDFIGPDKAIDTNRYQVLAYDFLGGKGDSDSPRTSAWAEGLFPAISTRDQAEAIAALAEALQITQFTSVIGSSYGGMVALALGALHPQLIQRSLVICAAHAPAPIATGWRHVQRELVRFGIDHNDVTTGLKLARQLAMTTYRSGVEFNKRFKHGLDPTTSCIGYLEHCGDQFSQSFDPYSYLCLSLSIDTHSIEAEEIPIPVDLLGFSSDQIVPPSQMQALHGRLPNPGQLTLIESMYGHDAFLTEVDRVTQEIQLHLEKCQ